MAVPPDPDDASPFRRVPASEHIASNELAFAIFDAYPVSKGHALVVPYRRVTTWFDASAEEQHAIMNLIERVKHVLDEKFHPDGYNVGFNAGEAAGQTVSVPETLSRSIPEILITPIR